MTRLWAWCIVTCLSVTSADPWPYNRIRVNDAQPLPPAKGLQPEFPSTPQGDFVSWLRSVVQTDSTGELQKAFQNDAIPSHVTTLGDLHNHVQLPDSSPGAPSRPVTEENGPFNSSREEAEYLFRHIAHPLDAKCISDKSSWWYRTQDGSCNWLGRDESDIGSVGTMRSRDYNQHAYADGISKPRDGPNARAVSNAFFKRKKALYYEHTPLLLGLVEFIMHDITYSLDSTTEFIDVSMPEDEETFPLNASLRVWRTASVPGTGTTKKNPRENANMATTWLDVSSLYGSTTDVASRLRSHQGGKLITQEIKARGTRSKSSYLPYNTFQVPTNTRPGVKEEDLFAGGDPRTNQDWMLLGVHTLLLREHNRLCDILAKKKPDWDDERLYQTVRLLMSAKFALIGNSYQMAYWTDKMPWPRDDGFPLYRQMYDKGATEILQIGPANTYPWPLVTKNGKPMTVSAEMAVVYRFHEFIISKFPIIDAANNTLWEQDLFNTAFDAVGFVDAGLENVLRGMVSTTIPNFKSGVDESFRSAGVYRGTPFDIVTWIVVPIRDTWDKFSSDPETVANLKRLYRNPDEVDLVVGVQLDEEYFPGTTIPKSSLIISLFSLFGMGNSDRFSVGFSMMRCLLVDKPWDCHPSNALEDLIWAPRDDVPGFPNYRFYDEFWLNELDLPAHGTNLLWRLITENSEVKCLQMHPLFPVDPETNPILCALPKASPDIPGLILTGLQVGTSLLREHKWEIIGAAAVGLVSILVYVFIKDSDTPPVLSGWPLVGVALQFQKNPLPVLQMGLSKFGNSPSRCFGIKLASHTHYVLMQPEDLELMTQDNPYEVRFSLREFMKSIAFYLITGKDNFETDLHVKLIRTHLGDPKTVAAFGHVIENASLQFLAQNPLAPTSSDKTTHQTSLNDWINQHVAFVVSRCVVGPDGFDDADLLKTFLKFNNDATTGVGIASLLPSFLQPLASIKLKRDFATVRRALLPVVERRRKQSVQTEDPAFLDFILAAVDDNKRATDLVAVVVWGGLVNLQITFGSTLLDIINEEGGQTALLDTLQSTKTSNLEVFKPDAASPWGPIRSAMFESIRLCGPATGPARKIMQDVRLPSQPSLKLPKNGVATLSAYANHRDPQYWGSDATSYDMRRFAQQAPPIGKPAFVSWGLTGPHTCPGRWFAQACIQIMTKVTLEAYEFVPHVRLTDGQKYIYTPGNVERAPVPMQVRVRR
ncbi:heme peroxidase [Xylariales sp. PMI_506]|nr:heme peroxidase [Xylariales sp. PMI_506]